MRKTFIETLVELAREDARVFLITPDIGYSVLEPFMNEFPERFLNVGVAEQNSIGIAAGLALNGYIPYVYTIMPFATMRPFEQIRVDVAYMKTNVRIVGVGAGFSYGSAGATHHSIEDIAIMRCLPNLTIICPGDPWETREAVKASLHYDGPIYLRLGKQGEPMINNSLSVFSIGKMTTIRSGNDFNIISTSNALELALNICNILDKKNIKGGLHSLHTIKPLDTEAIQRLAEIGKPIFTVEEHSLIGGLGSAVAEVISELNYKLIFKRFGVRDEFSHYVGNHDYIRTKYNLDPVSISLTIEKLLPKI